MSIIWTIALTQPSLFIAFFRITDSATKLALKWNINGFVCPSMDDSPWCPVGPGMHGYMHVGFGRDRNTFNTFETQHVFVGGGRDKCYKYCGKYRLTRVDPLNGAEWLTLPEKASYISFPCLFQH